MGKKRGQRNKDPKPDDSGDRQEQAAASRTEPPAPSTSAAVPPSVPQQQGQGDQFQQPKSKGKGQQKPQQQDRPAEGPQQQGQSPGPKGPPRSEPLSPSSSTSSGLEGTGKKKGRKGQQQGHPGQFGGSTQQGQLPEPRKPPQPGPSAASGVEKTEKKIAWQGQQRTQIPQHRQSQPAQPGRPIQQGPPPQPVPPLQDRPQYYQGGSPAPQQVYQSGPPAGQQYYQGGPPAPQQFYPSGPPQQYYQQYYQGGPPQGQPHYQRGPPPGLQPGQREPPKGPPQFQRGPPRHQPATHSHQTMGSVAQQFAEMSVQQQQPTQQPPTQQQRTQQQPTQQPPTQQQRTQQQPTQQPPTQQQRTQQQPTQQPPVSTALVALGGKSDKLETQMQVKPGTIGRKIMVESNHLRLELGRIRNVVHYDVAIVPDTPKCLLRDVMNKFRAKHYPKSFPAFDGRKNLYSPTMLPFGDFIADSITVMGENREKEFKVEVKFANNVDLNPLLQPGSAPYEALTCVEIVLRSASVNRCISVGRSFFTPPTDQIIHLGEGMEMYHGFYQSAIRGGRLFLNVDVAHKAFPKAQEVLDLICELGSDFRNTMTRQDLSKPLPNNVEKSLEKFLKMLKVNYVLPNQRGEKKTYRVNGLGEPARTSKFEQDDGTVMTIEQYFQRKKNISLKYPHLPTIWVGRRDRPSPILLPLEFCSLLDSQPVNRKMTENQTSAMIKYAATNTKVRKAKIMNGIAKSNFNNDPTVKEFGFSVGNEFEKLEARVLPPPTLQYNNNQTVGVSRGVWRADRSKFWQGAAIKRWTIACVDRYLPQQRTLDQLADMIYKQAQAQGMRIESTAEAPFRHIGPRQMLPDILQYFKTNNNYDLIIVIVPRSGPQYAYVKQAAELKVGCLTQCIKSSTLAPNKLNGQTVGNILLKINSKLNGTNHCLMSHPPIMTRPCMIMGADVTHPSPDSRDIPSVAAVTASHDPKGFCYNICWRLQPPKMEIIEDLCNIVKEQLMYFYKKTRVKPERIVFFRDGVSEGQFRQVQLAEVTAIQRACASMPGEEYRPTITFLVVQKRHHTRLFPLNERDSEDRNCNVPAGTCVDHTITHPTMQDFYLVSHASIQGVAKPTKYCTLWDDNSMSNDEIEHLTYHLCHMFSRCNRSVSYPAPTYYAHLAAARGKVYIENERIDFEKLKMHQKDHEIHEFIVQQRPMFFV